MFKKIGMLALLFSLGMFTATTVGCGDKKDKDKTADKDKDGKDKDAKDKDAKDKDK